MAIHGSSVNNATSKSFHNPNGKTQISFVNGFHHMFNVGSTNTRVNELQMGLNQINRKSSLLEKNVMKSLNLKIKDHIELM